MSSQAGGDFLDRLDAAITAKQQATAPLVGVGTCPDWGHCQPECTHEVGSNDAESVMRRCAADRRVLERHQPASDWSWRAFGCAHAGEHVGRCAHDRHCWPCPDILDLANGYGLTESQHTAPTDFPRSTGVGQQPEPTGGAWMT